MEIVGTYISVNKNGVENPPIAFNTPTVAAPAPNIVRGPRNRPKGATIANTIQSTSVDSGIIPPKIASKNGAATPDILLNIGRINKNPNKLATSTTPS